MGWRRQIQSLSDVIAAAEICPEWPAAELLPSCLQQASESLDADLKRLDQDAGFVFSADAGADMKAYTGAAADLFRRWHAGGNAPGLPVLSAFAMRNFGIHEDDPLARPVLMASLLGEAPNTLAYHNNMHYRKVLFQLIGMMNIHNSMVETGEIKGSMAIPLGKDHVSLLVAAACVHDLGHDGSANIVGGVYEPGRVEKHSFELARQYLTAAGFQDSDLDDLLVLMLCTDFTPNGKQANLVNKLKEVYRFHEQGGEGKAQAPELPPELKILLKRADLSLMAMILHGADIATSAGLDYEQTCNETASYLFESAGGGAKPSHIVGFIGEVDKGGVHADVFKKLYRPNMEKILAQAKQAAESGDHLLAPPEDYSFLSDEADEDPGAQKKMN